MPYNYSTQAPLSARGFEIKYSRNRNKLGLGSHLAARYVLSPRKGRFGTGVNRKSNKNSFEDLMKGLNDTSDEYTKTLRSVYDGYAKYAQDYEGDVRPIADALSGDISELQDYSKEYRNLLAENKDDFMNGIILDPNANRTRAEYTGAVADQYATAKASLNRSATSQGLNPYENKGASRDLALNRARDIGLASGKAYTDWRGRYNQDKQADLSNKTAYLGLQERAGNQLGNIANLRGVQSGLYGSILNANNNASNLKGSGYRSLLDSNDNRRSEYLQLNQDRANNAQRQREAVDRIDAENDRLLINTGAGLGEKQKYDPKIGQLKLGFRKPGQFA